MLKSCVRHWHSGRRTPEIRTKPLPDRALRFAPALRVLRIGHLAFPSAMAAAPRFPHLELVSFVCVDISELALHGVLAGCPVLKTLVLDDCTGFAGVRISSPTITSFAVSAAHYIRYEDGEPAVKKVTMREVVIEDAPLLEKLVPFRHWATEESFELRVVSAPRLRAIGSLSKMTSKLQLGGMVIDVPDITREKRLLMRNVALETTLQTVRIFALEDVNRIDDVRKFLRCFPCLEKLYVSLSGTFRSMGSGYDKVNPMECLERHLKMVAINGYEGKRSHVKFAKFFVTNARVLDLMNFKSFRGYCGRFVTEDWIADKQRQLQVRNIASQHVKFHFVSGHRYYYRDVYYCGRNIKDLSVHVDGSSGDDPFDQWFKS